MEQQWFKGSAYHHDDLIQQHTFALDVPPTTPLMEQQ
jgi:hypothetical protein